MDSKSLTLVVAVIATAIIWLLAGLASNMTVRMICVLAGVVVLGWAAGNMMNTPTPTTSKLK